MHVIKLFFLCKLLCWKKLCCAARGHALAVFYLLAPPPSLRSGSARRKNSLRPAQRQCFIISKNFKKAISLAKAPSHEKHFAPLDVRGLWHARPLPSILPFTSYGLRPRRKTSLFLTNCLVNVNNTKSFEYFRFQRLHFSSIILLDMIVSKCMQNTMRKQVP